MVLYRVRDLLVVAEMDCSGCGPRSGTWSFGVHWGRTARSLECEVNRSEPLLSVSGIPS